MKKLLLAIGVFSAFFVGYSAATHTSAYTGRVHNRLQHMGYFDNRHDDDGLEVLRPMYNGEAIPSTVNSATEFIDFVKYTKLDIDNNGSSNNQDKTGASFIIHTMLGDVDSQRFRRPTDAQIAEWERRVRFAESKGWISWRANYSFSINSYWQGAGAGNDYNDDAFYTQHDTKPAILFRNASGAIVYALKWECGNPVGTTSLGPIPDDRDWNAAGRSTVSKTNPAPGETITFNHYVRNNGPQITAPDTIWSATLSHPSNATIRAGHNTSTYLVGQEKLVDVQQHTIPLGTPAGTQICQKVLFDWASASGARNGTGAPVCATVAQDFSLTPIITVQVNGSPPAGSMAEQGDTITFTYGVNNGRPSASPPAGCAIYGRTVPGSYSEPTPPNNSSTGGYVPPATGCPRAFPASTTTTVATESIPAAASNTTICRSLFVNPATPSGDNLGDEVCVRIVARPYLKVYGGDVSVGGGIETAQNVCANNPDASIIGWNKHNSTYSGAGVQYAAVALGIISNFSSAQSAGTSAAEPVALSFANTATNEGSGVFGGSFGSVPCITDYYSKKPDTPNISVSAINLSPLGSGSYYYNGGNGVATLGGNVNPGNRIFLYVEGDLRITSNITYPGSWTHNNIPLLQLVVRGNIYIAPGVTQLDGIYIAQPNGSNGGTIYTCSNGIPLIVPNASYTTCNNKLTINGAFVAKSVEFLRSRGTLSQSREVEPSGQPNVAEVFNFNPALWIPQPAPAGGTADDYDAIISLPPIL